MPKKGEPQRAQIPEGWETAEEIAVETDRSVPTIVDIARDENIPSTNFPGHRRRRFSPENVARIKAIIEERDRRRAPPES